MVEVMVGVVVPAGGDMERSVYDVNNDNVVDGGMVDIVAGDTILKEKLDEVATSSASQVYVKVLDICTIPKTVGSGTLRITWQAKSTNATYPAYSKIYKNGIAVGVAKSTQSLTYVEMSDDIAGFVGGDTIEMWAATNNGYSSYVINSRVRGSVGAIRW